MNEKVKEGVKEYITLTIPKVVETVNGEKLTKETAEQYVNGRITVLYETLQRVNYQSKRQVIMDLIALYQKQLMILKHGEDCINEVDAEIKEFDNQNKFNDNA